MERRSLRAVAIGLIAAAMIGAAGFEVHGMFRSVDAQQGQAPGRPFTLVDQTGKTVTARDLQGRPSVLFFGFTYCPEVCPMTLRALTLWMRALGPDADRLNVIYVTIDPERDTPEKLARYLSVFDPRIRGLTGTPQQIAQIAGEYEVFYKKVPLEGGSYTMNHSTTIYLLDAQGRDVGVMGFEEDREMAITTLRALARATPIAARQGS